MISRYPALVEALKYSTRMGIPIPADLLAQMDELSLWDYRNALTRTVLIYINTLRTMPLHQVSNFGIDFANAIEIGLNEAWWRAMRESGISEMLPEWQDEVDKIIASERSHIGAFAEYLTVTANNAESTGAAMNTIQSRLDTWINRYEDTRQRAISAMTDEKTKMIWRLGLTEKHCPECAQLDGIVAYKREWDRAQIYPKRPPNKMLTCKGYKCDCTCLPTDERHTVNALDRLLAIGLGTG